MDNFKYKLNKINEVLKPKDVDAALIKRLEDQYGPMDMERDFFSDNLDTYFKTSTVDPETGSVGHKIIKLASFSESLQNLYTAFKSLRALSVTPEGKNDKKVVETLVKVREAFNGFRTYLRRYYPDQYESIKDRLDEMSTVGGGSGQAGFTSGTSGENYATPYAFKYKLKKKSLKEDNFNVNTFINDLNIPNPALTNWIRDRVEAFDTIERQLNQLIPLLQQAKKDTIKQYSQKPDFRVIYGTDLTQEYLEDIIQLFKQPE